jgi:hypothetical protein
MMALHTHLQRLSTTFESDIKPIRIGLVKLEALRSSISAVPSYAVIIPQPQYLRFFAFRLMQLSQLLHRNQQPAGFAQSLSERYMQGPDATKEELYQ